MACRGALPFLLPFPPSLDLVIVGCRLRGGEGGSVDGAGRDALPFLLPFPPFLDLATVGCRLLGWQC